MTRQRIYKLLLAFFSVILALFICEAGLKFLSFQPEYYYVWPPYFHSTLKPLSDITPGIKGESRFIVNSKGVRGDELALDSGYKILALGGSSTECTFLDQAEAWPFLLQERLTRSADGCKVWVGNAGRSGNTTRHHILQMKYLYIRPPQKSMAGSVFRPRNTELEPEGAQLPQFPDIDAVIILPGINDLITMLSRDSGHNLNRYEPEEKLLMSAFSMIPVGSKSDLSFYKKTALWQACKKIRYLIFSAGQGQDIYARQYITWRKHRKNASVIINVLPDMSQALEEYSRNINTMIDIGRQKGVRLIFMTQPVLWKPGLSKDLQDLLWLGGVGNFQKEEGKEYYSVDALAQGMGMYNAVLLKVCKDRAVECIDLASMLPKDTTVFYDDCHFNESGSQKVSEILAQYLIQHKTWVAAGFSLRSSSQPKGCGYRFSLFTDRLQITSMVRPREGFGLDNKVEMSERFKDALRRQYGGKAFGTMESEQEYAKRLGFKVPEFKNIGTEIFRGFLEHNSITREKINGIYGNGRKSYDGEMQIYESEVRKLFEQGKFTEEQEKELRKIFDAMKASGFPVIAIRSSSVLEDSEEHQFKGIYDSDFLCFSEDAEGDFRLFKEKIKMVYAGIFSPKARGYLKENKIPDTDEMAILVQRVVGKLHGDRYSSRFYPPLSGVTLFEPYSPTATVAYLNLGLNTKTVRGEYMWKWVCITDPSGQGHLSGSNPTLDSSIGQVREYYDIIDTSYGGRVVENYRDGYGYNGTLFSRYLREKENFLRKAGGGPLESGMTFSHKFAVEIDRIIKEIKRGKGKPVEIEWSVDDDGDINIYQCRFSYDFEKFYSDRIELGNVPERNIIAESSLVSGHREVAVPLILAPVVSDDTFAGMLLAKLRIRGSYILAVDLNKLINKGIGITAEFIPINLQSMIGVLNLSEEPVPLGAHWSEALIKRNIPIISTTKINRALLDRICNNEAYGGVRYSTIPVNMAVNGPEQRGRIWVPGDLNITDTHPDLTAVSDSSRNSL